MKHLDELKGSETVEAMADKEWSERDEQYDEYVLSYTRDVTQLKWPH